MFFPRKGTLTLTPGTGVGGDHKSLTKHKKKNRTEIVYTSGTCFQNMLKTIFKISSYIQKMTQNLINALKITIYDTKHTHNT